MKSAVLTTVPAVLPRSRVAEYLELTKPRVAVLVLFTVAAGVVLASGGYPGKFEVGKRIEGLTSIDRIKGVKAFHAGTKLDGPDIVTNGGRVLGMTAAGRSLMNAYMAAYIAASSIHFEGMHFRRDIGGWSQVLAAGN